MPTPQRTCAGCRTRRPQLDLLRLRVSAAGRLAPAVRGGPGRSVYLCADRRCWDRALRGGRLTRELGPASFEPRELWAELTMAGGGGV